MEQSFLTVDNHPLSLSQSLTYLSNAGQFQEFIKEIVKEHLIEQELKTIEDVELEVIDQFIIDFRLHQKLIEPGLFQEWLLNNHLTFAKFRNQVNLRLKKQTLMNQIINSESTYFEENKNRFDKFILSRIVVNDLELAQNLKTEIEQNNINLYFNQIAKQYSIVDDKIIGGVMSPLVRQEIPDIIKDVLTNTPEGKIIAPFEIDQRYCLIKIEKIIPAVLDGEIKQFLENEIIEKWIQEKLKNTEIKLDFLEKLDSFL